MAESVRVDWLIDLCQGCSRFDCPLSAAWIKMMTADNPTAGIGGEAIGRKHILPGQLFIRIGVFVCQSERQFHLAKSIRQILRMLLLHKGNLGL